MPEALTREPFLGGYAQSIADTNLAEVSDVALVSVAIPLGGRDALAAAARAGWGLDLPEPGRTARSSDGAIRLVGLAPDQMLAMLPAAEGIAATAVADRLGATGYFTEQSDNWVILRLAGPVARSALERICPVDLDPAVFPEGRAARTVMEHLGAVVLHEAPDSFLLLSASSSARSFLHAVETSLRNVA